MAVEWHEVKFGAFQYAKIFHLELRVEWTEQGYKIVFAGLVRKKKEHDLKVAMVAAEAFARTVLQKALEVMDASPIPEPVTTKHLKKG